MLNRYHFRRQEALNLFGNKCNYCGSEEELDFDHIDPDTKSFPVGKRLVSASWKVLEEELNKCQLLCRICHKEKTYQERK